MNYVHLGGKNKEFLKNKHKHFLLKKTFSYQENMYNDLKGKQSEWHSKSKTSHNSGQSTKHLKSDILDLSDWPFLIPQSDHNNAL